MQAGTESINNRDPSRKDWQPRGATDQLRQERRKKRQRSTRPDSNHNHRVQHQGQQNHKHMSQRTCILSHTHTHGGTSARVIRCSNHHLKRVARPFVYLTLLMTRSQPGLRRAVVIMNSGNFPVRPKNIKETRSCTNQQVRFLHCKHLKLRLGKC